MKVYIRVIIACILVMQPTNVFAQTSNRASAPQPSASRPNVAPQLTCAVLLGRYNDENKQLSEIWAEGLFDDSAPRESNRGLQALNSRMIQQMAVQMMISKQCTLPIEASGYIYYSLAAMECRTARRVQPSSATESPAACNKSTWRSITDVPVTK
jgi:hypothetical protein